MQLRWRYNTRTNSLSHSQVTNRLRQECKIQELSVSLILRWPYAGQKMLKPKNTLSLVLRWPYVIEMTLKSKNPQVTQCGREDVKIEEHSLILRWPFAVETSLKIKSKRSSLSLVLMWACVVEMTLKSKNLSLRHPEWPNAVEKTLKSKELSFILSDPMQLKRR